MGDDYSGFPKPEELRAKGWISEKEALKLLGLEKGKDFDWFDYDFIDTVQWGSDAEQWVLLLPEVAARLGKSASIASPKSPSSLPEKPDSAATNRKSKIANRKSPARRKPADPSLFPERKRIPSTRGRWGERPILISVEEAAARLGWSVKYTRQQMRWRYIQKAYDRDGKLCAVLQSVEWWLRANAESRARKKALQQKKRSQMDPAGPQPEDSPQDWGVGGADDPSLHHSTTPTLPHSDRHWIPVRRAAEFMGLTTTTVDLHIKRGNLTSRESTGRARIQVPFDEICRLIRAKEESNRDFISPKEWMRKSRKPLIRSLTNVPETVKLITTREVASILGVTPSTVLSKVRHGILFAWQKEIGKQGSHTFFSYDQVVRYSQNEHRLKHIAAYQARTAERKPAKGWEEKELEPFHQSESSKNTERDYGDYYTVRQAAIVLGIRRETVLVYRSKGRLRGYRRPISRKDTDPDRRWWFFLKTDVHALKEDPEYRRRSARFRHSQTPEARSARAEKALSEFFKAHEKYIPHDPANNAYRSTEARLRDQIRDFERQPLPDW